MTRKEMNKFLEELGGLNRENALKVTVKKFSDMAIDVDLFNDLVSDFRGGCNSEHALSHDNCALCELYYKCSAEDCEPCPLDCIGGFEGSFYECIQESLNDDSFEDFKSNCNRLSDFCALVLTRELAGAEENSIKENSLEYCKEVGLA